MARPARSTSTARVLACFLFFCTTACGGVEPLGEGNLSVNWQVSPSGCAAAGVEQVELRVNGPDTLVERFDCERRSVELRDVATGVYELEMVGYDVDGKAIFVAEPRTVTVESEQTVSAPTIRLLAKPATINVEWYFSNGRVCGANDVDRVVVAVFDDLDFEVDRETFDCNDGAGRIGGLRGGAYLVEVNGVRGSSIVWRATDTVKADRGDELLVAIELAPTH